MRAGAEQPQLAVRPPAEGDVVVRHEAAQRLICAPGIPFFAWIHLRKCEMTGCKCPASCTSALVCCRPMAWPESAWSARSSTAQGAAAYAMAQRVGHARVPAASSDLVRSSRPGFLGQLSSDGAALRGTSHTRQQQTKAAEHASSSVTPAAMPAMPPSASICTLPPTGAEAAHAANHWSVKHEVWLPEQTHPRLRGDFWNACGRTRLPARTAAKGISEH